LLVACATASPPQPPKVAGATLTPTQPGVADAGRQTVVATTPPTLIPTPARTAPTATVRRGTIEEIATLAGRVVGRNDLPITAPETTQTKNVYVGPGRTVSEGQPLIETEGTESQRRADEVRSREQAAARRVEAAQQRIQERQGQLTDELSRLPRPAAIASEVSLAQSAALQARVGLQRAEADLAGLTAPPSPVDVRVADQQIRTAELAVQRAEADRERLLDGPSDAELRQAGDDVAVAEAEVRRAIDALQKLEGGPDLAKVQAARRAVLLAQSNLQLAQQPPPEITRAQELVRAARNRSSRERRAVQEAARQQVEVALARQRLEVQRAEIELADAVRTLQEISQGPGTDEVEAASRDFDVALRKLASARERLVAVEAGPPQIEVDASNAAVEAAAALLEQSRARRVALGAGPPAGQVDAARAAVSSARVALAAADARVTELTDQQQEVAQAQAQLDLLNGVLSGAVYSPDEAAKPDADPAIVEFAEAQKGLAETRGELASVGGGPVSTTLVAPAAGIVTAVLTGPGEEIGPNRPAAIMVRTDDLVVQVSLETAAGSRVVPGMSARVRPAAAPDADLAATVDHVDATPGNRLAELAVAWPSPPPAPGVEAQVLVSLQRRDGALIVPMRAIRTDAGRQFVDLVRGNTTQRVEVRTGIADGTDIEVIDGIEEGQLVLVGT
jgi:multidrug efflux pump subunit AcrA (membrane-fusion protein)